MNLYQGGLMQKITQQMMEVARPGAATTVEQQK